MTAKKHFTIIDTAVMYEGFFSLHRYQVQHSLFSGAQSAVLTRELFQRGDCVAVLLYDPVLDKVVIIEQFRVGAMLHETDRAWMLEIVAGAIEAGETPEEVAYREAKEEAGCVILDLQLITRFYTSPGGTAERISLFYGRVDASEIGGIHGVVAEHEDILVSTVGFAEAYAMIMDGRIMSAVPIIALQWLALNKQQLMD